MRMDSGKRHAFPALGSAVPIRRVARDAKDATIAGRARRTILLVWLYEISPMLALGHEYSRVPWRECQPPAQGSRCCRIGAEGTLHLRNRRGSFDPSSHGEETGEPSDGRKRYISPQVPGPNKGRSLLACPTPPGVDPVSFYTLTSIELYLASTLADTLASGATGRMGYVCPVPQRRATR